MTSPRLKEKICLDCKERVCNEQALGCLYRLYTKPNWAQKRKQRHEKIKSQKRKSETGRTKYWREYKQQSLISKILQEL